MNDSEWLLRQLNRQERADLHRTHMTRDFPPDELKPLDLLERLIEAGINTVWGCFRGGELAGYFVLGRRGESRMVLLDYLAVVPALRGTGCGSAILREVRKLLPEGCYLLIESEWPEAAEDEAERRVRQRRIGFYQRCGGVLSALRVWLFRVDYSVLTIGPAPDAAQQAEDYRSLYRVMLPPEWYAEFVRTYGSAE